MKKIIAVVILVTLSLGMAQAEGYDYATDVLKSAGRMELKELQDKAAEKCGDMGIYAQLIETRPVSVGEAKYPTHQQESKSWFGKAIDWLTFWN